MTAAPNSPLVELVARAISNAPVERVVVQKQMKAALHGDGSDMVVTKEVIEYRVTDESRAQAALAACEAEAMRKILTDILRVADTDPFCSIGHVMEHGSGSETRALLARLDGKEVK
jgi:hypothetical protein